MARVRFPAEAKFYVFQTSSGAHPDSYLRGTDGEGAVSSPRGQNGKNVTQATHLHLVIKNDGTMPPLPILLKGDQLSN
jgi:hypothetical protein